MNQHRRTVLSAMLALPLGALTKHASAAKSAGGYPSRTVTLVVASAAGSSTDMVARYTADGLSKALGSTMIVDNRPGAGNVIGWGSVARSAPDGYTLLTTELSFAIAPGLIPTLPFDARKDFAPIVTIASVPHVMVVNADLPVTTVDEFVQYIKQNPGKLNYGSGGVGTNPHLCGEMFKKLTGVDLVHVPYKGAAAATQDLLAGHVHMVTSSIPTTLPHIQSGKLRALVVTDTKRSAVLPDVPAAPEVGLADMTMNFWIGIAAPAGTPDEIKTTLNENVQKLLADPDFLAKLSAAGMSPVGGSVEETEKFVFSEMDRWAAVTKEAGIQHGN